MPHKHIKDFCKTIKNNRLLLCMVILLTALNLQNYITRSNIGVVLTTDYFTAMYNSKQLSQILAGFYYGYITTQILSGYLTAKIGPKTVLISGLVIWSTFDFIAIFVSHNFPGFLVSRIILGMGEGVNFPCMHRLMGSWLPIKSSNVWLAIINSGQDWGAIMSFVLSPIIIAKGGWKWVFIATYIYAVVLLLFFAVFGSSTPSGNRFISQMEKRKLTEQSAQRSHGQASTPWNILRHKEIWAIVAMHFAANYGWYVLIGWIPKYFKSELHVSGENLLTTCLPYVFGVIGSYLAGYLSTASFIRKKIRLLWIRRFFAAISSFLPALFLIGLAVGTKSVVTGTALLCSSMFFARMAVVGYWANMIDVAPNNPEFVMGISNMVATIPGILGNNIVGVLMGKKNSWGIAFGITSGMYVVGGIIYLIFSGAEPLDREEASENKLKDDVYMESQMEFVEREEENNSEEKSQ